MLFFVSFLMLAFRCQCCQGVMKRCCTSCTLCCQEGRIYPASLCRYVDVCIDILISHPLLSDLEEYHILRSISLFTSENLILGRFSDKNILLVLVIVKSFRHYFWLWTSTSLEQKKWIQI